MDDFAGVLEDAVLGDQAADAAGGIDGAVSAHDGAGIAHGVAAELGPVADHGPYFLDAGLDDLVAVVHHYQVAVALDVGGDGACTHVSVPAEDGIADVVVVRDLAVVEDDRVLELDAVADYAVGTDEYRTPDKGTMPDFSVRAYDARRDYVGCGKHHGILVNPDLRLHFLIVRPECGSEGKNHVLDAGKSLPGPLEAGEIGRCKGVLKVEEL